MDSRIIRKFKAIVPEKLTAEDYELLEAEKEEGNFLDACLCDLDALMNDRYIVVYDKEEGKAYWTTENSIKEEKYDRIKEIKSIADFPTELLIDTISIEGRGDFISAFPNSGLEMMSAYLYRDERISSFDMEMYTLAYMLLYPQNPHMEQLVKAGFAGLVVDAIRLAMNLKYRRIITLEMPSTQPMEEVSLFNQGTKLEDILGIKQAYLNALRPIIEKDYSAYQAMKRIIDVSKPSLENLKALVNLVADSSAGAVRGNAVKKIGEILEEETVKGEKVFSFKELTIYMAKVHRSQGEAIDDIVRMVSHYLEIGRKVELPKLDKNKNLRRALRDAEALKEAGKNAAIEKRARKLDKFFFEDENFITIIPENARDFVEEGDHNCNCVAGYIDDHINGEGNVFFVRYKGDHTRSYITACLNADCTKLIEALYGGNEEIEDHEELEFLQSWMRNNRYIAEHGMIYPE